MELGSGRRSSRQARKFPVEVVGRGGGVLDADGVEERLRRRDFEEGVVAVETVRRVVEGVANIEREENTRVRGHDCLEGWISLNHGRNTE